MKKLQITVVVNGEPTQVTVNENAPLKTLVTKALAQTENTGQGPESWELRDAAGAELDQDRKIETYGFAAGVSLFLNLRAGVGGNN